MITEHAIAVPPPHPISTCHVVVAPRRHVMTFYELDVGEQQMVWGVVGEMRKRIADALKVSGFDIGFADGDPEHLIHAHIHVVPRPPGESIQLPDGIQWVRD